MAFGWVRAASLALMALSGLAAGQGGLSTEERRGIADALFLGNMAPADLEYARPDFGHRLMPLIATAYRKPLEGADALLALHTSALQGSGSSTLALAARQLEVEPGSLAGPLPDASILPEPLRAPVARICAAIAAANREIRASTASLSAPERRILLESLGAWSSEEDLKLDFVRGTPLGAAETARLAQKVDVRRLVAAGAALSAAVDAELGNLRAVPLPVPIRASIGGVSVAVYGPGPDRIEAPDALFVLDLGGDDVLSGRVGAGPGYASVFVDLGGDDVYRGGDLCLGAGLLGVGLAYDLAGDDDYRAGSISLGAAVVGVGMLVDRSGDDRYRGAVLTQGYAHLGAGLLLDARGNDRYDAQLFAQGAGRTDGVGWLVDRAGGDVYRAGGRTLNSPLFADVHYSFAQGMGMGFREDTGGAPGGLGLLTDGGGDDAYLGETYCQAASYWFAVGSLYDGGGHDQYSAYHYAQASAMHATVAMLFDLGGDDGYSLKLGAGHAIGHDDGVALLLDRAGSDHYAGRDSRPGIGNANGVGLFVDSAGEDRYFGPPGVGNPGRGSGSIGLFVDLSGADRYAEGFADGRGTATGTWGVALDLPTAAAATPASSAAETAAPVPGSSPRPSDAELEAIYARATRWGVGTAQQEVAEGVRRLTEVGLPAWEWMLERKLPTASRLEIRAFVAVMGGIGAQARAALAARFPGRTLQESTNLLRVATDGRATEVADRLPTLFEIPELRRAVAAAAGPLGSSASVPALMLAAGDSDALVARNALVSLAQLRDERAFSTAEVLLAGPAVPIRRAALAVVLVFPERASALAERLAADPREDTVRLAAEIFAAQGNTDRLAALLSDPRAGVKISALVGLDRRFPPSALPRLAELRNDPDPRVRTTAAAIRP